MPRTLRRAFRRPRSRSATALRTFGKAGRGEGRPHRTAPVVPGGALRPRTSARRPWWSRIRSRPPRATRPDLHGTTAGTRTLRTPGLLRPSRVRPGWSPPRARNPTGALRDARRPWLPRRRRTPWYRRGRPPFVAELRVARIRSRPHNPGRYSSWSSKCDSSVPHYLPLPTRTHPSDLDSARARRFGLTKRFLTPADLSGKVDTATFRWSPEFPNRWGC